MVRRRNGKRGKGMATKKEKTKEQRIKTEKTRLKGIFKDLDENKRKLVTPLIEKAAFMSVELDDLQAKLEKDRAGRVSTRTGRTSGEQRKAQRQKPT